MHSPQSRPVHQVELVPFGSPLFKGEHVSSEHAFCLFRCFAHRKREADVTFNDGSGERILDIRALLPFDRRCKTENSEVRNLNRK